MQRILEPELMQDEAQVAAYAQADFADSNRWYVERLLAQFGAHLLRVVDLGCGPGDVPLRLAAAAPAARITAVDGSAQMLRLARAAIEASGSGEHIRLCLGRLPGAGLPRHGFDAVLSKDMLHHLPDPHILWTEAARLARPGGLVYVMDLIRPDSPALAREIVERVAAREHPLLKEDFFNSLCAAFTVAEVRAQLRAAGLALEVAQVTQRHLLVSGLA